MMDPDKDNAEEEPAIIFIHDDATVVISDDDEPVADESVMILEEEDAVCVEIHILHSMALNIEDGDDMEQIQDGVLQMEI